MQLVLLRRATFTASAGDRRLTDTQAHTVALWDVSEFVRLIDCGRGNDGHNKKKREGEKEKYDGRKSRTKGVRKRKRDAKLVNTVLPQFNVV